MVSPLNIMDDERIDRHFQLLLSKVHAKGTRPYAGHSKDKRALYKTFIKEMLRAMKRNCRHNVYLRQKFVRLYSSTPRGWEPSTTAPYMKSSRVALALVNPNHAATIVKTRNRFHIIDYVDENRNVYCVEEVSSICLQDMPTESCALTALRSIHFILLKGISRKTLLELPAFVTHDRIENSFMWIKALYIGLQQQKKFSHYLY